MSGFVVFGGILVLLVATIVWAAIRSGQDTGVALEPAERRDAAIEALRDLEFEFHTGKLTSEEYAAVRARLERTALEARDQAAGDMTCPACRAPSGGSDAFCSSCGGPLSADPS